VDSDEKDGRYGCLVCEQISGAGLPDVRGVVALMGCGVQSRWHACGFSYHVGRRNCPMRRLILLPLLTLAIACHDNTPLQPDQDIRISEDREASRSYLLQGGGEWTWDGIFDWQPSAWCSALGGVAEQVVVNQGHLRPFGHTTGTVTNCFGFAPDLVPFAGKEIVTFRNGDELWYSGAYVYPPPQGHIYSIRVITGGTGRFVCASGSVASTVMFGDLVGHSFGTFGAEGTLQRLHDCP